MEDRADRCVSNVAERLGFTLKDIQKEAILSLVW